MTSSPNGRRWARAQRRSASACSGAVCYSWTYFASSARAVALPTGREGGSFARCRSGRDLWRARTTRGRELRFIIYNIQLRVSSRLVRVTRYRYASSVVDMLPHPFNKGCVVFPIPGRRARRAPEQ